MLQFQATARGRRCAQRHDDMMTPSQLLSPSTDDQRGIKTSRTCIEDVGREDGTDRYARWA